MGSILKDGTYYVQNTVAFSRNSEEQLRIRENNNHYSKLAGIISQNLDTVDRIIESLSDLGGQYSAASMAYHQYHNPKNNSVTNFINRNLYIDPTKKEKYALQRQAVNAGTRIFSEFVLKNGARMIINHENEKEKYRIYSKMYYLMISFLYRDRQAPGHSRAIRELSKIRSSFDLNQQELNKIKSDFEQNQDTLVHTYNNEYLEGINGELQEGLLFCLTALAVQMYDDKEIIKSRLSDYYDVLGYHGNLQREMIRVNCNDYDAILAQQNKMHIIASQMVQHLLPPKPYINIDEIYNRSQEIKRFDPYELRRRKNQKRAVSAIKTGTKMTICAVCQNYPAMAALAGQEALSQFNLKNDNIAGECYKNLRQWFGSDSVAQNTIKNAQQSSDFAKGFF